MSYSVISSTDFCGHVGGGYPTRCTDYDTDYDLSECKEICTSFELCIGYSVSFSKCSLMTSTGSCPNGWRFISGNTAKRSSDLIPSGNTGASLGLLSNCIAKGIE